MDTCDIILNKKSDRNTILSEISSKLSLDEEPDAVLSSAEEFLKSISKPLSINLYISNDDLENETINEAVSMFTNISLNRSEVLLEIKEDEFLNIIDENGNLTHKSKPRTLIHEDGDLHPTSHVWILKTTDISVYVLLQKRAACKELHPNCYDVSAAGHVTEGGEYRKSAVRELYEELGIKSELKQLEFIGMHSSEYKSEKYWDRELTAVYLYHHPVDFSKLVLQESEVAEVCWVDLDECLAMIDSPQFKHCISKDELFMVKKAVL